MSLRCLKKISPKTFRPHCVFAATPHIGGRYSPNMKHTPSQLKQKVWARKVIKHIFQKLTALSNYCSATWRRKSLLNYLLWGRDFNNFVATWAALLDTIQLRPNIAITFSSLLPADGHYHQDTKASYRFFSSSDAEHTARNFAIVLADTTNS
jgi:hypothetical protein